MLNRDSVLSVGGALAAPPGEDLVREAFGAELAQQRGLVADVGFADIAYIVAALEAGIVPRADGALLLTALLDLQSQAERFALDPMLGDVYTNREAWLTARTGTAGWLGVGRARRESITTGYTMFVRRRVLDFVGALAEAAHALIDRAADETRTLMPDYTYLQAGQPTTFAHYLLGFAYGIARDLARAHSFFARLDRCPAGIGSTNGSSLPLDRERLSALLGFGSPVTHARDAMWQADAPIEALAVTCAALVNLDRLAEDLAIFSTAEFGFVELSDAHSRASKVMPQKKNPFALTYVRAVANRLIGVQAGVAAAGRTPSGQMDNRLNAYGDVPRAFSEAAGALTLMAGVVRGLHFDTFAARNALDRSSAFASDLAEFVMRAGELDYRTAHSLVGRVCRTIRESGNGQTASGNGRTATGDGIAATGDERTASGIGPARPTVEDIDAAARAMLGRPLRLEPDELTRALDPALAVERRAGLGGAAAQSVAAMIADCRQHAAESADWEARTRARLAADERRLLDIARGLAGAG